MQILSSESSKPNFRGIYTALVTPFLPDGSIDLKSFERLLDAHLSALMRSETNLNAETALPVADVNAALALVRARASTWRVDPAKVGLLGFSAGAQTILTAALTAGSKQAPAFIAPIYPPMDAVEVAPSAPPMFAVLAADDPLFARKGFGLIDAWQRAHRPVEFHLYQKGGHGFGPGKAGTTSTSWIDGFAGWLAMNGFGHGGK